MSKAGFLIYKCRKCSKEVRSIHVPDIGLAVGHIASGLKLPFIWGGAQPELTDVHICDDGSRGVTDLIGGEEDKEEVVQPEKPEKGKEGKGGK